MITLIFALTVTVSTAASQADQDVRTTQDNGGLWFDGAWKYRKKIAIAPENVRGRHADFAVLVHLLADHDLARGAGAGGADIVFTSWDGETPLAHELESFNSQTGEIVAWVKLPMMSSGDSSVLYMYFGSQAPPAGGPSDPWQWGRDVDAAATQHAIVAGAKIYMPAWELPPSGGLMIFDLRSGQLLRHCVREFWGSATPVIGRDGHIHMYASRNQALLKIREADCAVLNILHAGSADTEGMAYDAGRDRLVLSTSRGTMAIEASSYRLSWVHEASAQSDTLGSAPVPLIVEDSLYVKSNATGILHKLRLEDGGEAGAVHVGASHANDVPYASPVYDADHGLIYVIGARDEIRAVDADSLQMRWVRNAWPGLLEPQIKYNPVYHAGRVFLPVRDIGSGYRVQIYGLHASDGSVVDGWPNVDFWEAGEEVSRMVLNDEYLFAASAGIGGSTLRVLRQADGRTHAAHRILRAPSSSGGIAAAAGGYLVVAQNHRSIRVIKIGDDPSSDCLSYMVNPHHTGHRASLAYIGVRPDPSVWDTEYKLVYHFSGGNDRQSDSGLLKNHPRSASVSVDLDGRIGAAGDLAGGKNLVFSDRPYFSPSEAGFTVEAWLRPLTGSAGVIMSKGVEVPRWLLEANVSGRLSFTTRDEQGEVLASVMSTAALPVGRWSHAAATVSSSGTVRLYVDGLLQATAPSRHVHSKAMSGDPVVVGAVTDTNRWVGSIDEIRISDTERSPDWLWTQYANHAAPAAFLSVGELEVRPPFRRRIAGSSPTP